MTRIIIWIAGAVFSAIIILYASLFPLKGWEKSGSELVALSTALFWEGAISESGEGLHAIAWTIFNRVESRDFPDTIREVVAEGATPGKRSGCQFSFACDGEVETPRRLCELHPKDTERLGAWGCERRYLRYLLRAAWWLYIYRGSDPTEGAVLYYTGEAPYWAGDMVESSIKKIGSHTFARSKWIGRDVAKNE